MTTAKFDIDMLVPIVIGVFWVVAQITRAAGKKKQPGRSASAGKNPETSGDPFAEFMQKLAGVQDVKIPTPPEPREFVEPKPVAPPANPWNQENLEPLPDMMPIQRTATKPQPVHVEIAEIDIRPTMNSFQSAMPAIRLPSMKLHFQGATRHNRDVDSGKRMGLDDKLNLKTRRTFRRAVLGHIILSKPKALQGWNTGTVE